VTWTTVVLESLQRGETPLMLVRGSLTELAWSDPQTEPRLSILSCSHGDLIRFTARTDDEVRVAWRSWDASYAADAEVLLSTPLRHGEVFGQDPPREDILYAWYVEFVESPARLPDSCESRGNTAFGLTYRTVPDRQFIEWRPGIGITSYEYEHHGSLASADVVLESCSVVRP
jgi:hypothetical protein